MNNIKSKKKERATVQSTDNSGTKLGRQLVEKGRISEEDIRRIVACQRERGLMFGEAAIALGIISKQELQHALAEQYSYPYVEVSGSVLSPLLVTAHKPFSAKAEAFRTLRSELMLRWFNDRHTAIAVTSPRAGPYAGTVAANLAICFAQLGERTLLIDANFRDSKQQALFGLDNSPGLSGLLTGRAGLPDAMTIVTPFENLSILPTGAPPPNPQELLGRVAFSYLIETAPSGFDVVIVDTPPILEFADAQLVASVTGGCLLAVERHRTSIADIELSKLQIVPTGAELVGAVVLS